MKIGILIWDLNITGGTQRQALELANRLQEYGIEVIVYCYSFDPDNCYKELCSKLDIRYVQKQKYDKANGKLHEKWHLTKKYFKFYFEIEQKEMLRCIDDEIDLLNAHDYRVYPTAGRWKSKTGKPVVWMMNDMPLYRWGLRNVLKTGLYYIRPGFLKYIKSFEKILVLDNMNKLMVKSHFKCNSEIVRSGLDIEQFPYFNRASNENFEILSTGIFFPHRRIEDTIHAISILRRKGYNIKMKYIGTDERDIGYAKRIYNLVEKLGLTEHINFCGKVSEQQLLKTYRDADAFVFPNSPQTWGLSVFEAMSCGVPVIITTGCGAAEVLRNDVEALIVEPRNPSVLAGAIEKLHNNIELRTALSINGRIFVEKNISWQSYTKSMLAKFKETMSAGHC